MRRRVQAVVYADWVVVVEQVRSALSCKRMHGITTSHLIVILVTRTSSIWMKIKTVVRRVGHRRMLHITHVSVAPDKMEAGYKGRSQAT